MIRFESGSWQFLGRRGSHAASSGKSPEPPGRGPRALGRVRRVVHGTRMGCSCAWSQLPSRYSFSAPEACRKQVTAASPRLTLQVEGLCARGRRRTRSHALCAGECGGSSVVNSWISQERRRLMFAASRTARQRAVRPVFDVLEGRALLSTLMVPPVQVSGGAAESDFFHHRHGFHGPIVPNLPATPNASISTVPSNRDVNPYGVAFVPEDFPRGGLPRPGDILVSNFNNSNNVQGTGTTIVRIRPRSGRLFFTSEEPGLSTALGALKGGFVIVGNAPTPDGTLANMGPGSLQVIDRFGHQVLKLTDPKLLQGVWDLTVNDFGPFAQVFVSNALTGAVTRIDLLVQTRQDTVHVLGMTQIASGYAHVPNAAAVVLAPTGLAFDAKTDTLYVASTGDNAIYAVANAAFTHTDGGKGTLVFNDPTHLNGPLGLA